MMLYIAKIDDYLKILTEEKVNDFVAINFSECFKSTRKILCSKLSEEQNLRKAAKSLYIFFYRFVATPDKVEQYVQSNAPDDFTHRYNIEIFNLFDPELQLINTKPMIKNKLKQLLSELKKFKV